MDSQVEVEKRFLASLIDHGWEGFEKLPPNFRATVFSVGSYQNIFKVIELLHREKIEITSTAVAKYAGQKLHRELALLLASVLDKPYLTDGELQKVADELIRRAEATEEALIRSTSPDLALYLDRVVEWLLRYVVFPSEHEARAIALWVAHAWIVERFEISPILVITSAEMRSGKSRLLDVLQLIVPHAWRVITPSEAVVFRVLSQRPRRTMLLDEADAIFGPRTSDRNEGLRAILNSGNAVGSPVPRVKMNRKGVEGIEEFDVFGPKAISAIGSLPRTITDRGIVIRLKRRAPNEPVKKFRRRIATSEAALLTLDWAKITLVTDVTIPDALNDRASDGWEPLIQIAETAGGQWPENARAAALALSIEEDTISIGIRLLDDIRECFWDEKYLETKVLLERLTEMQESPWGEWYGKPLSPRGLAKLLEPYRIHPVKRRLGIAMTRGYFKADFEDVWKRYVPSQGSATSATSATVIDAVADVADVAVPQDTPPENVKAALPF
jgi:hypothetical protein